MQTFECQNIHLYCSDTLSIMDTLEDSSIGACFTDPPYPRKFASLYWETAARLKRILVRGGSYLAIMPQYNLPEILQRCGEHLKWRWMLSMWQEDGTHPRMAMGIEVMYKPIGWWVKDAWPCGRGFRKDGFRNPPPAKHNHEWEQSLAWAEFCLKFHYGGTVLDPFLGGGTMVVACLQAGIPFIGIENDPEAFEVSVLRCKAFLDGIPVPELGQVKAKR